ncbi:MAG: hypothetical protein JO356_15250 [Acidobacteria bacterium]|nr:hypothetical protein [Acidobacteriota bacterium]
MEFTHARPSSGKGLFNRLNAVPASARKLFAVIVREAYHGPIHPKPKGVATPPEILEACGLDVGEFYALLNILKEVSLITVSNDYPFEEIALSSEAVDAELVAEHCRREGIPLEDAFVNGLVGEHQY